MEAQTSGAQQLERRAVGLPTAISTVFGLIVASTVLLSVGQGYAASWIFLIAMALALLTMYMQALSFSELATLIPKAGSMNEYVRAGLGPFFGSLTALMGYIAIVIFPGAAEAALPSIVLSDFLGLGGSTTFWVAVIVVIVAAINIAGVRQFAAVEITLTGLIAISLAILGIIGLLGLGVNDPIGPLLPSVDFEWSILSGLLGLAVFAFVGLEYTCPLAEELEEPKRQLPLGMFLGLALIAVPLTLYGFAATRYVPADVLGDPANLAYMEIAIAILGDFGKWWIGLISVAATISTLNAVVAGVPRLLYGMAHTQQAPRVFGHLLPSTRTPAFGIIVVSLPPLIMNALGWASSETFIELILAGVLGWATAYILIHITLIVLRIREPNAVRPFKAPLVPLPQLIGTALLIWAAVKIFPDPEIRDHIYRDYLIFLGISVAVAFLFNLSTMRSVRDQFRPVPLREVYAEVEFIEELEEGPGGPGRPGPEPLAKL